MIAEEKKMLDRVVAMAGKQSALSPNPKDYDAQGSFQPAKETKKIPLDPENPESLLSLGQTWTVNRKASSSTSSVRIETSSHGPQRTCRVSRRISPSTNYMSELMRSRSRNPSADYQKRSEELWEKR